MAGRGLGVACRYRRYPTQGFGFRNLPNFGLLRTGAHGTPDHPTLDGQATPTSPMDVGDGMNLGGQYVIDFKTRPLVLSKSLDGHCCISKPTMLSLRAEENNICHSGKDEEDEVSSRWKARQSEYKMLNHFKLH